MHNVNLALMRPALLSELENYLNRIEDLHSQINRLLAELSADGLNWRPLDSGEGHDMNSLAVLATHVAGAEHFWITEVIAGREATRDREAEFAVKANSAVELLQLLDRTLSETRSILSSLPDSELSQMRTARGKDVPVRWAILHVIDHTALHLGHMQITYQLWARGQAKPSPYWADRLPEVKD